MHAGLQPSQQVEADLTRFGNRPQIQARFITLQPIWRCLSLPLIGSIAAGGAARIEDQRDVARAERARGGGEVDGGAVVPEGGGELLAVVDELADEGEQAPGAAG